MAKKCDCCGKQLGFFDECQRVMPNGGRRLNICESCTVDFDNLLSASKDKAERGIHWGNDLLSRGTVNPEIRDDLKTIIEQAQKAVGKFNICDICGKPSSMRSNFGGTDYEVCRDCFTRLYRIQIHSERADFAWAVNALNSKVINPDKKNDFARFCKNKETEMQNRTTNQSNKMSAMRVLSYIMEILGAITLGGWVGFKIYDISILLGMIIGGAFGFSLAGISLSVYNLAESLSEIKEQNRIILEKIKKSEDKPDFGG